MKQIQVFEAVDGTRFDDQEDCEAYENSEFQARVCKKLGISVRSLDEHRTVRWFIFKVQKAVALGAMYLESPERTAYNHMRKWLDQDQSDLVTAYQDWLQLMGAKVGRTPQAVHGRLRAAYKTMEEGGEHVKA